MNKIDLTNEAFEYLFIQRGEISHIEDRYEWHQAYEWELRKQFESIAPYLPTPPNASCNVLDIGGGMGGINILLHRHFDHASIAIVDGINDPCVMHRHAQTFNNAVVGLTFLSANGIEDATYFAPDTFPIDRKFNLVISFASYCFHYPPSIYLDRLRKVVTDDTVLIFDVRRDRDWETQLHAAFGPSQVVAEGRKFQRMAFGGDATQ